MKLARLIVLFIAIAAGGIAALLAGRSDHAPPAPSAPGAQPETAVSALPSTGTRAVSADISPQSCMPDCGRGVIPGGSSSEVDAAPASGAGSPASSAPR